MTTSRFNWTEEYCKAVKHYLDKAQKSAKGKNLKSGELDKISNTLGIEKSILVSGIRGSSSLLNKYLRTGVYHTIQFTPAEVAILVDFVLHNSDNLQHAFRSTALYYRANGMSNRSVSSIDFYYYTRLKPVKKLEDWLFNIESRTDIFNGNVKNNIPKGQSTIGVR